MKKYVISDLHGRYNLFKNIYDKLEEDDILYILGDTIDRGTFEDTIAIYDICMKDKRVVHLLGNHEDMVRPIFKNIISDYSIHGINALRWLNVSEYEYQLWSYNGGQAIIQALIEGRFTPDKLIELHKYIKTMPITVEDEGYILSHAGVGNCKDEVDSRDFSLWNVKHNELLDIKQVVGHVFNIKGEHKRDKIVYVDTSNFKDRLGVFELTEGKLFNIKL